MFSKWDKKLETIENTFKRYSERRKNNIYKSLIRPLYQEFLKCFFLVFILLLNSFIILEIIINFFFPLNIFISLIIIFACLFIEIKIYILYWGNNGKWSLEKKVKKNNMNKN
jgi:NADH:ubiquinone oxidoreductase subunit 3 (subunit A)